MILLLHSSKYSRLNGENYLPSPIFSLQSSRLTATLRICNHTCSFARRRGAIHKSDKKHMPCNDAAHAILCGEPQNAGTSYMYVRKANPNHLYVPKTLDHQVSLCAIRTMYIMPSSRHFFPMCGSWVGEGLVGVCGVINVLTWKC